MLIVTRGLSGAKKSFNGALSLFFSVDYTVHISYHYQHHLQKDPTVSKHIVLQDTVRAVGWPMVQAGISTFLAVFPLVGLYHVASVFVRTMFLLSVIGLIHGLVIVPTLLANCPKWLNGLKIPPAMCRKKVSNTQVTGNENNSGTAYIQE